MVDANIYAHLSAWLAEAMRKDFETRYKSDKYTLQKGGAFHKKFSPRFESLLIDLVKEAVCRGKERNILCGEDSATLYVWKGDGWEEIKDRGFLSELIERTLRSLEVGLMYQQNSSPRIARSCMETLQSSEEYLYKPNRRYVAFTNGVFDLGNGKEKGRLRPFSREFVPAIVLDIPYANPKQHYVDCSNRYGIADNPCKLWERFIKEVMPNKEFREAFQSFCGALLADRDELKIEYMCCVHGPGSNGKSVLVETISKVFGKRYYSAFTPKQLFSQGTSSMFCMADLDGKIVNLVGDLDSNSDFSGGAWKSFVSGEDVRVRSPYERKYRWVKPPLMMCCTNEMPRSKDDSHGNHRRILPIASTEVRYEGDKRDTQLTHKLTTADARTFIFSWIYEGYKRVMANKGDIPLGEEVLRAIETMQNERNSMRLWWFGGECPWRKSKGDEKAEWVYLSEIYRKYKDWCKEYNERPFHSNDLGRMISSLGFSKDEGNKRSMSKGTQYLVARKDSNE